LYKSSLEKIPELIIPGFGYKPRQVKLAERDARFRIFFLMDRNIFLDFYKYLFLTLHQLLNLLILNPFL